MEGEMDSLQTFIPQIGHFRDTRLFMENIHEKTLHQQLPALSTYFALVASSFKILMLALNWPDWPEYENAKVDSPEHKKFHDHKLTRKKNVSLFYQEGGVKEFLNWIPLFSQEPHPEFTFFVVLSQKFVLTILQAAEYEQWEQKFFVENGAIQKLIPLLNNSHSKAKALTLIWGALENFEIRPILMKDHSLILEKFKERLLDPDEQKNIKKYVLGCLQLLTTDIDNGLILIQNDWFQVLFQLFEAPAVLTKYFVVLILSNMLLFAEKINYHSEEFSRQAEQARTIISSFIHEHSPLEISVKEGKSTSWQSMKPFTHWVQSHDELLFSVGTFAMAQLTYRKLNRELVVKEDLVELLLCCQWSNCKDQRHKEWEQIIVKNLENHIFAPSLQSVVVFQLRQSRKISHQDFTDHFSLYIQYPESVL